MSGSFLQGQMRKLEMENLFRSQFLGRCKNMNISCRFKTELGIQLLYLAGQKSSKKLNLSFILFQINHFRFYKKKLQYQRQQNEGILLKP